MLTVYSVYTKVLLLKCLHRVEHEVIPKTHNKRFAVPCPTPSSFQLPEPLEPSQLCFSSGWVYKLRGETLTKIWYLGFFIEEYYQKSEQISCYR